MKVRYAIYQIPDSDTPRDYFFGEGLERKDAILYRSVWAGTLEGDFEWFNENRPNGWLESIFRTFNLDHPDGYRARSLSCGDVVGINYGEGWRHYYCARVGFEEVTDTFMLTIKGA